MIADLLLTIANITFVIADLKQAVKIRIKRKCSTKAFSKSHYRLKLFSLFLIIIAYILLNVHLALITATLQLLINIYILKKVNK